ncbi:hypothetical protein MA16_Dca013218 [Dendrobium catenatum]|uniref:Protein SirB1 N-terminal domain-containing protein n=2 Tax=Dendrobium catenatum TaxID=906689 RepID=A0A2I0WNG3_9ASPA|nr:hypothetical protein MA16_Dca013218 [Dendrobium catenatum]
MSCLRAPWASYLTPKLSISKRFQKPLASPFFCLNSASDSPELVTTGSQNSLRLILHDSLESAGIDTRHARSAREEFRQQVARLTKIDAETSITISRGADLARTALHIAAEDDSLVSHSSVPLPVEAFVERLDDLSMEFCSLYLPPSEAPPEVFLGNLDRFFYVHKGFCRTEMMSDARALYLHSVLTCRSGSAVMLSLIYSEMLKTLRVCGFLDFDAEIYYPSDFFSLPSGYQRQKSKFSDQPHILTSKSLLVEILRNLKDAFWPFQYGHPSSLFLRAAYAANHVFAPIISGESNSKSYGGLEMASAKAAQHRLGRGVWTNARFGDMRRALAACERLIILGTELEELRDYAVLLYHCGHYEDCSEYLKLYQSARMSAPYVRDEFEEDIVKKLEARVNLILAEKGWSKQTFHESFWNSTEPWKLNPRWIKNDKLRAYGRRIADAGFRIRLVVK